LRHLGRHIVGNSNQNGDLDGYKSQNKGEPKRRTIGHVQYFRLVPPQSTFSSSGEKQNSGENQFGKAGISWL
jgi:hypothetical protein